MLTEVGVNYLLAAHSPSLPSLFTPDHQYADPRPRTNDVLSRNYYDYEGATSRVLTISTCEF